MDPHEFTSAKATWERCPVATNQCVCNECRDGCALLVPYKLETAAIRALNTASTTTRGEKNDG